MKRVLTLGRDLETVNQLIVQAGLELVSDNPEVVVTHGGDGRLLEAERLYPGVPKVPIRSNSICRMCIDHDTTHIIQALAAGTISTSYVPKLETQFAGKTWLALNEFSIHHVKPYQAIRFSIQINQEDHVEAAIGDGVVIATPFGSHAYYRSITKSTIQTGLGLAFNNTTEPIDHVVLQETDQVTVKILRGPAYLLADNNPETPEMATGDTVVIKQSTEKAILLGIDQFKCPECGLVPATVIGAKDEAK